jgi:hypothetical protein
VEGQSWLWKTTVGLEYLPAVFLPGRRESHLGVRCQKTAVLLDLAVPQVGE